MFSNPGCGITLYHVAGIFGEAYKKACTPATMISGFEKCGIYPLNADKFNGLYAAATVTDVGIATNQATTNPPSSIVTGADDPLPLAPERDDANPPNSSNSVPDQVPPPETPQLLTGSTAIKIQNNPKPASATPEVQGKTVTKHVSPQDIIPLPKVDPAKEMIKRKKFKGSGKAKVLTASPYRNELSKDEEIKMLKEQIRVLQQGLAKTPSSTDSTKSKKKRVKSKKLIFTEAKSDKSKVSIGETPGTSGETIPTNEASIKIDQLNIDDFVLVKIGGKHWVGYICRKVSPTKLETRFLRRKTTKREEILQFVYPEEEDILKHKVSAVKIVLPKPSTTEGTDRVSSRIAFPKDLFSGFTPIC